MKEIEFRVYDSISKKIYPWSTIKRFSINDFILEHYTIMQYTTKKDKHGNKIFDGDILSEKVKTDEGVVDSKQQVFWNEHTASYHLDNSYSQDKTFSTELWLELERYDFEIVGNIYKTK